MALKKALVLNGGEIEELQAGDTLDGPIAEVDVVSLTNSNAGAITEGQPVYIDGADSCDLARANAASTRNVIGLVRDASIAAAATGDVQTDGILSVADWTSVLGAAALTPGTTYYLSAAVAGQITATAPTGAPNSVVRIGTAISGTDLEISIGRPIARG